MMTPRPIKRVLPETTILVMTGYTEEAYRRLALAGGGDGLLDKGALVTDLLPAMRDT